MILLMMNYNYFNQTQKNSLNEIKLSLAQNLCKFRLCSLPLRLSGSVCAVSIGPEMFIVALLLHWSGDKLSLAMW